MNLFDGAFQGTRILLTGHTGFKGSWLSLWLTELEADVTGFALSPEAHPNHWDLLGLPMKDLRGDIRDSGRVQQVFRECQPELVLHLAAQPLVRRSYRDPLETWSTNVVGTANILEACRMTPSVRAVVVVTTDKCYRNQEQIWGYRETDVLGGHDPYSASKAAAELVVSSYRESFFSGPEALCLASARAGNVIGGGDWCEDRLIPDAARAVASQQSLEIRSPNATRPWQHVLESLSGYLLLAKQLLQGRREFATAWNFGPGPDGSRTVSSVLCAMKSHWDSLQWHQSASTQPHETTLLQLDSTKAHRLLSWRPVWSIDQGLTKTAEWYDAFLASGELLSRQQLSDYMRDANLSDRNGITD